MKKLLLLVLCSTLLMANSCEQYYLKFESLIKESREHARADRIISELNTLDQARYWLNQYAKCKNEKAK